MVETGPFPGDGESRPPRKPRHEQRSGRTGAQDRNSELEDRYGNERTGNRDERHQKRQRDRHQDRGQRRSGEDVSRAHYQNKEPEREERGQSRQHRDRGRDGHRDHSEEDRGHSRSHQHYKDREGYRSEKSHSQGRDDYRSEKSHSQGRDDYRSEKSHSQGRDDYRSEKSHSQGRDDYRSEKSHSQGRDDYRSEKSHSQGRDYRSEKSHSQGRDDYRSEKSYSQGRDDYQERNRIRFDDQERYVRGSDLHGYPDDNRSGRSFPPDDPQITYIEDYEETEGGILDCHKCQYLCTGRGILQMLEVILNALVLICIISSYFVLSGFSAGMASGGFGGGYYPFEGQELQQVRQLDQEFSLLRAPLLYGGLSLSLVMGTLTLAILAAGSKHLLRLSDRWIVTETVFSSVASLGYGAAVGVFLHFALQINATDVCKRRERLYARNGLTWMNCDLAGTDGGAATFAIVLVILYGVSAVLAIRTYREKKSLQQQ
ncbi:MARVEL domain-containing protein 3 isoform 2-T3 [Mantella aurantiaca]